MKAFILRVFVAAIGMAQTVGAQQLGNSSGNFETDLGEIYGAAQAVRITKDICAQEFPNQRPGLEASYVQWRAKYLSFLQEVEHVYIRTNISLSGGDPTQLLNLDKMMAKGLGEFKVSQRRDMAEGGRKLFEARCLRYDTLSKSQNWNLESSMAEQVATMRRGPIKK
jgi:hypothetical protein